MIPKTILNFKIKQQLNTPLLLTFNKFNEWNKYRETKLNCTLSNDELMYITRSGNRYSDW